MKNKFFQFLILSIIVLFIVKGEEAIFYAKEATELCYNMIIPTLFPFFICSGILIYSGFCETVAKIFSPVMKPLFNVSPNGSAGFILGIISGYPLGAITVCNLYEGHYITKTEAERMLGFCNNSGPLFILGSIGIGMYFSVKVGIMLYIFHIISAVFVGVILGFYKRNDFLAPETKILVRENSPVAGFGEVLENSLKSILNVCGAVMFFSVVSRLLLDFVNYKEEYMALIYGICEFASGTARVSALDIDFVYKMVLSSLIVGFAGISVHIQVLSVVSRHSLSMKPYIFGKILHGTISAVLIFAFLKLSDLAKSGDIVNLSSGFMMNSIFITGSVIIIFIISFLFKRKREL